MPQCAVATCRNSHRKTKGRRVRYHRFPADEASRRRWVSACGRGALLNAATARVCSLHFSALNYERDVQHELLGLPARTRLKRGAVPDRDVPEPPPRAPVFCRGRNIDLLLALGLVPRDDSLNRMHVMDDDCSSKTEVDDMLKSSESPQNCQSIALPEDSDSGKENSTEPRNMSPVKIEEKSEEKVEDAIETNDDINKEEPDVAVSSAPTGVQNVEEAHVDGEASSGGEEEPKCVPTNEVEEHEDSKPVVIANVDPPSPVPEEEHHHPVQKRQRKRQLSDSENDFIAFTKKLKAQGDFDDRDRTIRDYVESNLSVEDIQQQVDKLHNEILTLGALARAKENEWNNIIRMKKIKEEAYLRLYRKKQVLLLMMGSTNKPKDVTDWDLSADLPYGGNNMGEDLSFKSRIEEPQLNHAPKGKSNKMNSRYQNKQLENYIKTANSSVNKNGHSQVPLMVVPMVSTSPMGLPPSLSITSSAGMNSAKLNDQSNSKDKSGRLHRPILPKPSLVMQSNSDCSNGSIQNSVIGEGRQGPILDVRRIIADYRSKNPGDVPRRGRRLRTSLSPTHNMSCGDNLVTSTRVSGSSGGGILSMASLALGSGSQMRPGLVGSEMPDLSFLLNNANESSRHESSRPSSADSSRSGNPTHPGMDAGHMVNFKDILMQFAKLSQTEQRIPVSTPIKPPPYPEVTLHPVLAPSSPTHQSASSSLLHGILTKSSTMQQHRAENNSKPTTFSPTLARLLTTPDRMSANVPGTAVTPFHRPTGPVSISDLLSTSKNRNEITITPVSAQQPVKAKEEVVVLEEEQEDSADRLVIDESTEGDGRGRIEHEDDQVGHEISSDDVPECQGCHQRAAQFVCAGCGNQWYCSRDCQVSAWDEHSEVCSG